MKEIVTRFHNNDPRNANNQLLFQQHLIQAQMLEGMRSNNMAANIDLKSSITEIYSFVLSSQIKYVKFDMKHPFLESTYLNVAIFNRTLQRYGEALMMFKRME